jgi:DNA topoisomerase-1
MPATVIPIHIKEARHTARKTGLRYISDKKPGITRKRHGKSFTYYGPNGGKITDQDIIRRIRSLVIPPAWQDVWISPFEDSHLQVTGKDVRGRKQYRYHPNWSEARNETKFSRMRAFADSLPKIRKAVEKDLAKHNITKNKVIAIAIRLMETVYLRVGNDEYVKENGSYGLTTLRDKHVDIQGDKIRFCFKGKKGVLQETELVDKRMARLVKKCKDIPGYELFQYYDEEGKRRVIDSGDINEYLKEVTGENFTSKDFRTWAGTVQAFTVMRQVKLSGKKTERHKQMVAVIKEVARKLGNTPSVCRKYYIHPMLVQMGEEGKMEEFFNSCRKRRSSETEASFEECMLDKFLEMAYEGVVRKLNV